MMLRDLLGPAGGPEEEIAESSVRDRYLVGMLAPRRQRIAPEEQDDLAAEVSDDEDGHEDPGGLSAPTMMPSSFGLTFTVDGEAKAIRATARWGRYERRETAIVPDPGAAARLVWKRVPTEGTAELPLHEGPIAWTPVPKDQAGVVVQGVIRRTGKDFVVSLFLVNQQEEPDKSRDAAWLFQPELVVEAVGGAAFVRRPTIHDRSRLDPLTYQEERSMAMLNRHRNEYAVGHGIAVHADVSSDPYRAERITTRSVPIHELAQQEAPTPGDNSDLTGLALDMKDLGEATTPELVKMLSPLPAAYEKWIAREQEKVAKKEAGLLEFEDEANSALDRCQKALKRIRGGIDRLSSDERAAQAFRFANRAMHRQRVQSKFAEKVRRDETAKLDELDVPKNRSWRTFQLAFILLNVESLSDLGHPDRVDRDESVADLLWFPTGGGKTEAYLGLTAFMLAMRRLQGKVEGRSGEHGIAVLMRYTLRLLTLQQFQRAAALICACEILRREAPERWGQEPFRLGLWVGKKTTPNKTDQAEEWLKQDRGQFRRGSAAASVGSPAQLTNCPWCGVAIDAGRNLRVESFGKGRGRTLVFCGDKLGRCEFSERGSPDEGIPALVVDEEIYRLLPSLLIATVDKFAQMPWNGATQMLFGRVNGLCTRHGFRSPELEDSDSHPRTKDLDAAETKESANLRPPDLIIQDELHLISGPLGTMTGLYETAVDALCSWDVDGKRVRPKVIASTATIRRAKDQVHAIFARQVQVFPPHGTDVRDNFFSVERDTKTLPGRRYIGICAPGKRQKVAIIRVYVACLAAAQRLFDEFGTLADPWMTLVGYFNSMRTLAGTRRVCEDDVRSQLRNTDRRGLARRFDPGLEELTSRKGATEIPELLDRLEVPFEPKDKKKEKGASRRRPIDILLATNMISVGVDVGRLGLMVVDGQPKTSAEYIQATSRVGRHHPGLVCAIYNWARPRDLSHYERFEHYHATFYQHVEALSVTPFAPRALDRGLTALLVSLIRLAEEEFNANEKAETVTRQHNLVQEAFKEIVARAERVSGSKQVAKDVGDMLDRRIDVWRAEAARNVGTTLGYKMKRDGSTRALLRAAEQGSWEEFTCLNSLRDVEPTVGLVLQDGGLDDAAPRGGAT